ncbi:hypothetical protein EDD16DRAFT_1526074 [Pisolithus croceorrhizus]|nr:hypothetical protein EDD16DRAFT_1526074 [Pisolithus croceorrhizus]
MPWNSLRVFHMGLSVEADNTGWWELGCNMESSTVICEIIRSHNFELVMSYYHSDICCESPPRRGGVAFAALTCLTFRGLQGTVVETIAMDNGKWRYHVLECIEDSHRMVVWGVEILFSGVTSKDQASPLQGCKMESSFTPDQFTTTRNLSACNSWWGILGATYVGTARVYSHSEFGSVSPGGVLASTSVSTASPGGVLAAMPINTAFECHQGASWPQTLSTLHNLVGWVSPGSVLDAHSDLPPGGILDANSINTAFRVPPGGVLATNSVNTACVYYHSEFSWVSLGGVLDTLSGLGVPPGGVLAATSINTACMYYYSEFSFECHKGASLAANSVNTAFECHKGASWPPDSVNTACVYYHSEFSWVSPGGVLDAHSNFECHQGASWPPTLSTLHLGVTGGHLGRPLQLYFECMMSSHTWILVECHQGASWLPTLSTLHLGVTGGHLGRPLQLYFECMMSSHTWILVECHQGASWPPTLSTLHWGATRGVLAATSVNTARMYYYSECSWVSPGCVLDAHSECTLIECHQGASWLPPPSALQACTLTGNLVVCHQGSVLAALPDQLGVASGHPGCTLPLQVRYDTANALVGIQDAHTTACSMLVT